MAKFSFLLLCLISILFPVSARAVDLTSATISGTLSVSATINPRPVDFDFTIGSDAPETVTADQQITYTIDYGSKLDTAAPLKIEAQWTTGSIPDRFLFAYNILSYVPGSASKDYLGTTIPIVDNTRKKITWIIKKFPAHTTDKYVTFTLKTPGVYVTDQNVHVSVNATLATDGIAVKDARLTHIYSPKEFIRTQVRGMHLLGGEIRRISDTSFSLFLTTSVPTKTVISYGSTPDLEQTKIDNTLSDAKTIVIDG